MRIAVPTDNPRGLKGNVAEVFSRAPFFALIDFVNREPRTVDVIENIAFPSLHGVGPIVVKMLSDNGVELLLAPEIGIGAMTLLNELKIKYKKVEKGSKILKILEELKNSSLE